MFQLFYENDNSNKGYADKYVDKFPCFLGLVDVFFFDIKDIYAYGGG